MVANFRGWEVSFYSATKFPNDISFMHFLPDFAKLCSFVKFCFLNQLANIPSYVYHCTHGILARILNAGNAAT